MITDSHISLLISSMDEWVIWNWNAGFGGEVGLYANVQVEIMTTPES